MPTIMKAHLTNILTRICDSTKDYVNLRQELFKLTTLKNITRLSTALLTVFTFVLAGTILLIVASATFIVWYGRQSQDYLGGLLIVMGVVLVFSVVLLIFHKKIFNSLFIKLFSGIIFDDDDED